MKKVVVCMVRHHEDPSLILYFQRKDNGKYTTPGGHLNPNEDPQTGALRELEEETGIKRNQVISCEKLIEKNYEGLDGTVNVHLFEVKVKPDMAFNGTKDNDGEPRPGTFIWLNPIITDKKLHAPKNRNIVIDYLLSSLSKAKEDLLVPDSQRKKYRKERREMTPNDPYESQITSQPGISDRGIEVRRASSKDSESNISHGYARVISPQKHLERAKAYFKNILNRIKIQDKPNLIKTSRPRITSPHLKDIPTRTDQQVQLIETPHQKEIWRRKVAQANYLEKKNVPQEQVRFDPELKSFVRTSTIKDLNQQKTRETEAKRGWNKFGRGFLGLNVPTSQGPKSAAIAGKYQSKFEDDDTHQQKIMRGKVTDRVIEHEAFRHIMDHITNKYGKPAYNKVIRGMTEKFDPHVLEGVAKYIERAGYKRKSPASTEEVLAAVRDILTNPKKGNTFKKLIGENGDEYIKRLKRGYQQAYEYARNLKPQDLGKSESEKKQSNEEYKLPEGMIYIASDGDNAGSKVEMAAESNDIKAVKEISDRIWKGIILIKKWIEKVGGEVIVFGGDDSGGLIPKEHVKDLDKLREAYEKVTGFTVTIGVGDSIPRAVRALLVGKLTGKNKVVEWSKEVEEKLKTLETKQTQEEKVKELLSGDYRDKKMEKYCVHFEKNLNFSKNEVITEELNKAIDFNEGYPKELDAQLHVSEYVPHTPSQKEILHGLNIADNLKPLGFSLTSDIGSHIGKVKNSNTKKNYLLKECWSHKLDNMRGILGKYLPSGKMGGAHREVAFHNIARDFFGLGDHVPETAKATIKDAAGRNKRHLSVQKWISNAKPGQSFTSVLPNKTGPLNEKINHQNTIQKLSLMDSIMGNYDRHGFNYLVDKKGHIYLIDNGLAFNFQPKGINIPHPHYAQFTGDKIDPEVWGWLLELDENDFEKHLLNNKVPKNMVKQGVQRLRYVKNYVARYPHASLKSLRESLMNEFSKENND